MLRNVQICLHARWQQRQQVSRITLRAVPTRVYGLDHGVFALPELETKVRDEESAKNTQMPLLVRQNPNTTDDDSWFEISDEGDGMVKRVQKVQIGDVHVTELFEVAILSPALSQAIKVDWYWKNTGSKDSKTSGNTTNNNDWFNDIHNRYENNSLKQYGSLLLPYLVEGCVLDTHVSR